MSRSRPGCIEQTKGPQLRAFLRSCGGKPVTPLFNDLAGCFDASLEAVFLAMGHCSAGPFGGQPHVHVALERHLVAIGSAVPSSRAMPIRAQIRQIFHPQVFQRLGQFLGGNRWGWWVIGVAAHRKASQQQTYPMRFISHAQMIKPG